MYFAQVVDLEKDGVETPCTTHDGADVFDVPSCESFRC